ncbi:MULTISPECIES: glycoside hydrolase family 13 protein [Peribacillus]|uniref:glycoside hydrolase family 13 protein n=1 Tax=Peribacillus TaxID=2675229 RepID=UPI001F4E6C90|nr:MULTISPECIES: alpha-glucosidase [unclassified Peribacillus]MCK1984873.1 alpha-glucosidase [Peribacillus sp. Aquil_B1]MCK2009650.1 alpha-glucosidase [Peribacillus sp. Aquil_B8]
MDKAWWKEAVVYQVYPRSFMDSDGDGIGDINGILMKLDYLQELGVDVIWLSPVYQSPNDDNGYDISDYKSIMTEFGTMADFDRLLNAVHERGMKIMMDLVVNHSSDEHPWFKESRSSKDNPKRDYYIWKPGRNGKEPNNWESIFKGSAWEYDEGTDEYYLHLFSRKQPDLNWENPKLREEIYSIMTWWLDKGVDGFRMDVINFLSKDQSYSDGAVHHEKQYGDGSPFFLNGPRIHEFLQEVNQRALSGYDVITVGEMPGVTPEEAQLFTGKDRDELHMVFQFEHMDLGSGPEGKWSNDKWKLTDLKRILSKWQTGLEGDGWNSLYWNNHDQPRVVSRFGHDGKYRIESAKMLAACLHMLQGTPYIYQGEELGMTNVAFEGIDEYRDIETLNSYDELVNSHGWSKERMMSAIHARSRDNARTPIQWNDSRNAGFTQGTPWIKVNPNFPEINAEKAYNDHNSIFHFYKKLIQLRKEHDIVVYGRFELLLPDDERIFAYTRSFEEEKLLVLCNFKEEQAPYTLPEELHAYSATRLIGNYDQEEEGISSKPLQPYECRVYHLK